MLQVHDLEITNWPWLWESTLVCTLSLFIIFLVAIRLAYWQLLRFCHTV